MRISDWSSDVCSSDLLGATLRTIAEGGTDAFYHGKPAQAVAAASAAGGGLLTPEDFAKYTVRWDEPVLCDYRGYTVVSAPPSSSGGTTLCEILQTIEGYPLSKWGFASVPGTHVIIEARSEEHTSELKSLMSISYAVFCLKKKNQKKR